MTILCYTLYGLQSNLQLRTLKTKRGRRGGAERKSKAGDLEIGQDGEEIVASISGFAKHTQYILKSEDVYN